MNCQRVKSLLSTYLDEMLPARDAGRVAGHLARCEGCRRELQALEAAITALDRVQRVTPPIDLWARLQERITAQHAAAPGPPAARPSNPSPARRHGLAPAGRAAGLALASIGVVAVIGAGLVGYRIGLQSDPNSEGVLSRSLVSVVRPPEGARGTAAGSARTASGRRAPRFAAIPPPEASMAPWHVWGPRDRDDPSARDETNRPDSTVPPLPSAAPADPTAIAALAPGVGGEEWDELLSVPASASGPPSLGAAGMASKPGVARAPGAPIEPIASTDLADALQQSIEEEARRQVAEEVALLALALGVETPRGSGNGREGGNAR